MILICALQAVVFIPIAVAQTKTPVIIDTDLGQDMDDAWSVGYLLMSPDVDVRLITTVSRCTIGKADLLAKYLTDANRTDVAIGVGAPTSPPFRGHGDCWCNGTGAETGCANGFFVGPAAPYAQGFRLADYKGPAHPDAVSAMAEVLAQYPATTLISIGAFTNLAALQQRFPDLIHKANVIAMAGSIFVGWNAVGPPMAEYNVATDVDAARAVLRNSAAWSSFAIAPLDSCGNLQLVGEDWQALLAAVGRRGNEVLTSIMAQYDVWYAASCKYGNYCSPAVFAYAPGNASTTLFDVLPAYMASQSTAWSDLVVQTLQLDVNSSGFTVASPVGGVVNVTVGWAPGGPARLYRSALERLAPEVRGPLSVPL